MLDPKRFTRKGATVGTPLYAAPEQARGRHDVDGRADIFSLGTVLNEALSGEPPFIDETTRRLLPPRFVVGDTESMALLFAETGGAGPERPRLSGGQIIPMVGRERELEMLMALRHESVLEKAPRAALVVGGTGTGKTRLAREVLSAAGEPPCNIIRCTGTLLRSEPGFPMLAPLLAAADIPTAGREASAVKWDFVRWLRAKAESGALILVVEDLQWADTASVNMIDEVLHLLERPMLVLAMGRPEVEERFPGLWSDRRVEYIRLASLTRKSGQTLLSLRAPTLSGEGERFILERWEGNPMFLEEMADALAAGRTGVPEVVLAAVESRFDCLSPETRRVLRAASLYGDKFFSAEALVAVLGETSRREMGEWLENLVMRDFVQRQVDGNEVAYRVRNKLVREAAYRMLTASDRVLGRRLARSWLQGAGRTLPDYLIAPSSQADHRAATGS